MEQEKYMPRTMELPRPAEVKCPYEEAYTADIAVVGCGFAGLNAAVSAKENGAKVLVIDKGRPGYSGLSPWPSSFRWFDPDRGDDEEAFKKAIQMGGDYLSNLKWYEAWIKESKGIYRRLSDWGILAQYPGASKAGRFYEREDFIGYRETYERFDRHKKWVEVLEKYEIPFLEHTMVTDLCTDGEGGRKAVNGVIGFHVPSGQVISVSAKAVVLATGGGCYKPTGYPVGGDTFDGEYMAFELGLPITGKEFEDFHSTSSQAPGNVFLDNHWQYLENIWLCGGDVTRENAENYAGNKGNIMALSRVRNAKFGMKLTDGSEIQDVSNANYTRRGGAKNYGEDPKEIRSGKRSTPVAASALAGAATGMCSHLTSGVFCGLDDEKGETGVGGLFVAGDGIHATSPSGASYPCGVGFTSCFCSIDGDHAGRSAADYSKTRELHELPEAVVEEKKKKLMAPMNREKGFDANWARDVLHSIMAPYWVSAVKSEATLKAALAQVEYMEKNVIPKLCAPTSHDLRLCHEMAHKVLSAKLKLRAGIERAESRGNTYREDYPYRDDENYLCYLLQTKEPDNSIRFDKVQIPDAWAGNRECRYEERYLYYFPGEPEAIGFQAPKAGNGEGKKREEPRNERSES